MKRCIKSTRSVFLKNPALRARSLSLRRPRRSLGEERAERGISTKTGSGREIQKGKLSFFCYCLSSSQRNEPKQRPFNVLRGLKQNFICEKSQKPKIRTRDKEKIALLAVKLETFPSRLHRRS